MFKMEKGNSKCNCSCCFQNARGGGEKLLAPNIQYPCIYKIYSLLKIQIWLIMTTNLPFLEQISKKSINSFLKIQVSMNIKIPHFRTHLNEEVHHACRWSEHHLSRGKQEYNFAGLHRSECSDCGYEPIRKVNRFKHNCPVQDNLDNKGMSKWNCEKVPFCTVQHLKFYLMNSVTIAKSIRSKRKVW